MLKRILLGTLVAVALLIAAVVAVALLTPRPELPELPEPDAHTEPVAPAHDTSVAVTPPVPVEPPHPVPCELLGSRGGHSLFADRATAERFVTRWEANNFTGAHAIEGLPDTIHIDRVWPAECERFGDVARIRFTEGKFAGVDRWAPRWIVYKPKWW